MNEDLFDDLEAVTKSFFCKWSESLSFLLISDAGIGELRGVLSREARDAVIKKSLHYERKINKQ